MMDNYFINYSNNKVNYIIPDVNKVFNNLQLIINRATTSLSMEVNKVNEKFNPYVIRISHPIDLEAFVYGPDNLFYKVIEGLYMLEDGTIKLKVKKKYGQ
jgi:hypothetical protein